MVAVSRADRDPVVVSTISCVSISMQLSAIEGSEINQERGKQAMISDIIS